MTVGTIGVEKNTPQISRREQKEQTVQRVKLEFLKQVQEGVTEKEAFKNSLKAINEKYNPDKDMFCTYNTALDSSSKMLNQSVQSVKKPNPETVKVWLEIIEKALPVILTCRLAN